MIWKFQCTQTDKTRSLKVTVDILNFQRCTFPCSNVFFEFRMYSRDENWFHNALSKSSAEENKSKGIPKTVWSQSWGCFLSVLASISLMQIMSVSHQHRLRKRFSRSGKCNYQRANRTTHHLLPINYFSIVRSEINHFLPMRAWQCYLTVYSFERMRCATSKDSTI